MAQTDFAELISRIAHELRAPLTSIRGFSATLSQRWDRFTDEQRRQFVETISSEAERMGRVISEVLDLARLDAGTLRLNFSDTHLASVVTRALEQLSELPGAERVTVDVDDVLTVWADPLRLQGVIATLTENAIKFSEQGPIELSARRAGSMIEISVADHGVGIEEEHLSDLFTGLSPRGRHAAPYGTGLGLYLSSRVVGAHGGSISAERARQVGSKFTVKLPAEAIAGTGDGYSSTELVAAPPLPGAGSPGDRGDPSGDVPPETAPTSSKPSVAGASAEDRRT